MDLLVQFFIDVFLWHVHIDVYYIDAIAIDIFFLIIFFFFRNIIYLSFRKRLHIRDMRGQDRRIGTVIRVKKWKAAPNGMKCGFQIKFRRRGWLWIKDLIHPSILYYMPLKGAEKRPVSKKWRDVYIAGNVVKRYEHPGDIHKNYYVLHPEIEIVGQYEHMGDYIGLGKVYIALTSETVQTATQADPELIAKRFKLDSVPLPFVYDADDLKDSKEKLLAYSEKFNGHQA